MSQHSELITPFRRDGFVAVGPLLVAPEIDKLRNGFDELQQRFAAECEVSVEDYSRVVSQWTSVWNAHPAFAAQIHHPRVEEVARALLGVDRLQLFHDHLISKPPRHSETIPWHQDYPFWPIRRPRALSCWLALDDVDEKSGVLTFMPGAQIEGEQPAVDFLRANKEWGERSECAQAVPVPAGWGIFHDCLSWHMSPPNLGQNPRRAFISIFMDSESRWDPGHSGWHPMNDYVTVAPGERFNKDRFPLIRKGDADKAGR